MSPVLADEYNRGSRDFEATLMPKRKFGWRQYNVVSQNGALFGIRVASKSLDPLLYSLRVMGICN
jgi:hypothetical protein